MITLREFMKNYLFKVLLAVIIVEIGIFAWLQKRNHRPNAADDEFKSFSGKVVKVNVLRNDSDKDEDAIFIQDFEVPKTADIELDGSSLLVKINKDFVGVDSIEYTISDGKKTSQAYLKFIVEENKPPTGKNDKITGYTWSKLLNIYALQNDRDMEDDSFYIHSYSQPLYGKLELKDRFIYIPDQNFIGIDSFKYILSDNISLSDSVVVTIERKQIKTVKQGLRYDYYEGEWRFLPDFNTLTPLKSGIISNVDLKIRDKEKDYAIRYHGFLNVLKDESYTFYLSSDDGSQLFIDSKMVINNDGRHGVVEVEGKEYLSKGKHAIQVLFFQAGGGQMLELKYETKNTKKRLVANSRLLHVAEPE